VQHGWLQTGTGRCFGAAGLRSAFGGRKQIPIPRSAFGGRKQIPIPHMLLGET
jgi:hypothetical protein